MIVKLLCKGFERIAGNNKMKLLYGTGNLAKLSAMRNRLEQLDIELIGLNDLRAEGKIIPEVIEDGNTPLENARLKAMAYYEAFQIPVFSCDSGLYFEELSLNDVRQPGLNVRTPMNMQRLSDEQMIDYYSRLIKELGGKVSAFYLDGIAVYNHGKIYSFMDMENARKTGFDMIDKPAQKYFAGWPLDSLSINRETKKYFVDEKDTDSKENIFSKQYKKRIVDFLKKALDIDVKNKDL